MKVDIFWARRLEKIIYKKWRRLVLATLTDWARAAHKDSQQEDVNDLHEKQSTWHESPQDAHFLSYIAITRTIIIVMIIMIKSGFTPFHPAVLLRAY